MNKEIRGLRIWLACMSGVVIFLSVVLFSLSMYTMSLSGWNDFQDERITTNQQWLSDVDVQVGDNEAKLNNAANGLANRVSDLELNFQALDEDVYDHGLQLNSNSVMLLDFLLEYCYEGDMIGKHYDVCKMLPQ